MIKPQTVEIENGDGELKTFVISRVPATYGREIFSQYVTANVPKLGNYEVSEALMLKLMAYVGVPVNSDPCDKPLMLKTKELVNNHVTDFEMLGRLEMEMIQYNVSFFRNGKGLNFLGVLKAKLMQSATSTLTGLLAQFSQAAKQH